MAFKTCIQVLRTYNSLAKVPGLTPTRLNTAPRGCRSLTSSTKPHLSAALPSVKSNEDGGPLNTTPETLVENPLEHPDFFRVAELFTLKDLFYARVHLGHNKGVRNPLMMPYIFGTRLQTDIIDLEQTVPLLQQALNFTAHVAFRGGIIMFVSRHQQLMPHIEATAEECGEYSHCREWKGGTFTNANVQFRAVTRLPDVMIFLSTHDTVFEQHLAVREAAKLNIPSVAILDTSCDPELITYPVPGNDDSVAAIRLYCRLFKLAILRAKATRQHWLDNGLLDS